MMLIECPDTDKDYNLTIKKAIKAELQINRGDNNWPKQFRVRSGWDSPKHHSTNTRRSRWLIYGYQLNRIDMS